MEFLVKGGAKEKSSCAMNLQLKILLGAKCRLLLYHFLHR